MRPSPLALALAVVAVAGCSDDSSSGNPPVLWLALDGSETQVRLVGSEPSAF